MAPSKKLAEAYEREMKAREFRGDVLEVEREDMEDMEAKEEEENLFLNETQQYLFPWTRTNWCKSSVDIIISIVAKIQTDAKEYMGSLSPKT